MATHYSTLAWRIPWTEEPDRVQSMGSQSRTSLSDFTFLTFLPHQDFLYTSSKFTCLPLIHICSSGSAEGSPLDNLSRVDMPHFNGSWPF